MFDSRHFSKNSASYLFTGGIFILTKRHKKNLFEKILLISSVCKWNTFGKLVQRKFTSTTFKIYLLILINHISIYINDERILGKIE